MATVAEQMERMCRTADDLAAALRGTPEAALAKRPAENARAAKEVIRHLCDTEESFMGRSQGETHRYFTIRRESRFKARSSLRTRSSFGSRTSSRRAPARG